MKLTIELQSTPQIDGTSDATRISQVFREAFLAHPLRHSDSALALESARETAAAIVPHGITGHFDDEALTFTSDVDDAAGLAVYFLERIIAHLEAGECDHSHCHMFDGAGDLVATVDLED